MDMKIYRWMHPYREWIQQKYNSFNNNKQREAREALKLINRAMFPYPSLANRNRVALAVQYMNRKMGIHTLRQQINMRGRLMRTSPPVSPAKKKTNKKPGASSPIPIKKKTRK